jgi:methyltransferase
VSDIGSPFRLPEAFSSGGFWAFLVVLGVMALARIIELVVARRLTQGAAARGERPQREPIFVLMVVLHTLPFVLAPLEVVLFKTPFRPALFAVATAALGVLLVLRVWTLSTLGAMWNVRIVKPATVVTSGPYRFIRHPNYAIVIAELFVMPLVHGAWMTCLALSLLNAFVLWRRIPAEERVLFTLPGYGEAMGKKARFIPGLF